MTDLTPLLNEVLKRHSARPTVHPSVSFQTIDEFLKEAYRINSHIASLNTYLRGIRQSYLSTAQPPRRIHSSRSDSCKSRYLTDRQRDEIDAETKQLLRELNASIRNLADAEQLRQNTQTTLIRKKYATAGLGVLSTWAAGGAGHTKSYDQELDEARSNAIKMHRENVIWYLRQKLQECGSFQASMMETRITREMEKNKSLLYKARAKPVPEFGGFDDARVPPSKNAGSKTTRIEDQQERPDPEDELSPEQLQMFEKENHDMMKHYEATLDQVRTAEKSLVEISELQTQLVSNLATQSAHIDQLVADSFFTAENVGGGNRQLKKATERQSTANKAKLQPQSLHTILDRSDSKLGLLQRSLPQLLFGTAPPPPPLSSDSFSYQPPTVEDEQPWIQVGSRRAPSPTGPTGPPIKRRRAPGRPLGSTKASKNTKDIREIFQKLYD